MIGKYERTYYQRKKASKTMKKVWANRRRSAAMKAMIEARKAAGHTHHTNGKPYRNEQIISQATTELNKIEQLFGAGTTFKMLTPEQRRQYYNVIDTRRNTKTVRVPKIVPMENRVERTLRPLQLLITVSIVDELTGRTQSASKILSIAR